MNIGISTSVIQRGRSGIAQYVFGLLQGLLPNAHKHRFILFVLENDLPLFDFVREQMTIIPVSERWRPPVANILWHQTVLPSLAHQHELDVLHIPSYRRLPLGAPCPVTATIHDLAPFHLPGKYDFLRMFYGRRVVRRLAQRLPAIIAVSTCTARDLVRFFQVDPGRVRVVHNGIDHKRFHPGDAACARKIAATRHGLPARFFLYVARLEHPAKNHLRLIEAFNQFKRETPSDTMLMLAGSDWHGAETIHRTIRTSPFAADIRAPGFVPDAELPNLYRAAEAMVYPSLFEGFGLPPVEAMACGCPVICSARGTFPERRACSRR